MTKKRDEVRKRILRAALEVISTDGYEGASTRAIAERAGIAHPLMRYYFRTKEDLWFEMAGDLLEEFNTTLSGAVGQIDDDEPETALRTIIDQIARLVATTPGLHRLVMLESFQKSSRHSWLLEQHVRKINERIMPLVIKGQARGTVRKADPMRLTYSIYILLTGIFLNAPVFELLSGADMFDRHEIEKTRAFIASLIFEDSARALE